MIFLGNFYGKIGYFNHIRSKYEAAEKYYLKMRKHKGNDAKCNAAYALILMRKGEFDQAIEVFNEARQMNPSQDMKNKIRLNRAIAYYKIGQLDRAIKALEDIHEKWGPMERVYETLGYLYIVEGDYEKALKYNLEALDYEDSNYVILDNLGQSYMMLDQWDKARDYCEKALELKNTQVDILYHLALIEKHDGNREKALEFAQKASEAPRTALNDVNEKMLNQLINELTD